MIAHGAVEVFGSRINHLAWCGSGKGSEEAQEDQEDEMNKMHLGCGEEWRYLGQHTERQMVD